MADLHTYRRWNLGGERGGSYPARYCAWVKRLAVQRGPHHGSGFFAWYHHGSDYGSDC